jgi:hypothetical protein
MGAYLLSHIYMNPLYAELNDICYLLALLGAHPILHVSRIRVNGIHKNIFTLTSLSQHVIQYVTSRVMELFRQILSRLKLQRLTQLSSQQIPVTISNVFLKILYNHFGSNNFKKMCWLISCVCLCGFTMK